jgi:PAS domain S-box-containing protein
MNQTLQEGLWDLSQPGELYRLLFEESTDGIFITDPRGRYVAVNPRGTELTGYDREELLSMSISDLIPSEDLAREPIRTGDLRQGRIMTNERRIRRKDGRQLAVEIRTRMLPNGNILGIATDITDRKLAEAVADQNARELANARLCKAARQELAERERSEGELSWLNAILENTSDLVSAALPDARLTYLNRAGRRMAGWDQEESLDGKVIADLHPDWVMRKIESEGLPSAAAFGSWEGETAIRHRDGREIPVSQVILRNGVTCIKKSWPARS